MRMIRGNDVRIIISQAVRETITGAVDLILPFRCAICGKVSDTEDRSGGYCRLYKELYGTFPKLHLCGKCLSSLSSREETVRWHYCLSNPVENDPHPELPLYLPFPYKGIVERAMPRIKFGRQIELARFFGSVLGTLLCGEDLKADLIVPVPLSSERFEERGFNQASEIAYPVSKLCNIPFADDCLIRLKDTARQSETKENYERAANVSGAFGVSGSWDVTGITVIVADDVATTGSTLHEAALALYKAGASKVLCIAFAGNRQDKY